MNISRISDRPRSCLASFIATAALVFSSTVFADDAGGQKPVRSNSHAPIGVMGEHMHKKGGIMVSYRFMRMDMDGNRIGTNRVSPDTIVTTVPNRFAPPPTLRIVPLNMTMDMHMFGVMYAPTDWVTLMFMGNYLKKEMDHVTYQGGMGTTVLGNFTTKTDGIGDSFAGGLFRLIDTPTNKLHFNFGFSLPTGDIKETGQVLTPTNMMPTVRLPYAMQLGSGTWDVKPGFTYNGGGEHWTWGAQYIGTWRIGDNSENYDLGTWQELTGWGAYSPVPAVSISLRVDYKDKDSIKGIDAMIAGPVQTANPDFYGGKTSFGYLGVNLAGQRNWMRGHRIALEYGLPIRQDLNGPQLETDNQFTFGYQYSF